MAVKISYPQPAHALNQLLKYKQLIDITIHLKRLNC